MTGRLITLLTGLGAAAALWIALRPPAPRYPIQTGAVMLRLDASGDGRLDAAEYAALGQPGVPLGVFDGDGDGAIDAAELEALLLGVDPTWMAAAAR